MIANDDENSLSTNQATKLALLLLRRLLGEEVEGKVADRREAAIVTVGQQGGVGVSVESGPAARALWSVQTRFGYPVHHKPAESEARPGG